MPLLLLLALLTGLSPRVSAGDDDYATMLRYLAASVSGNHAEHRGIGGAGGRHPTLMASIEGTSADPDELSAALVEGRTSALRAAILPIGPAPRRERDRVRAVGAPSGGRSVQLASLAVRPSHHVLSLSVSELPR